jgi:uridine kinase
MFAENEILSTIADYIVKLVGHGRIIVGIAGGPGSGKSYFSKQLQEFFYKFHQKNTLIIEIDDFIYSTEYREKHSIVKTQPYSIEIDRCVDLIQGLKEGLPNLKKPVYNKLLKDRDKNEVEISGEKSEIFILDGLLAISSELECGNIYRFTDLAIYFDVEIDELKRWWLHRAALEREKGIINTRTAEQALEKWNSSCAIEYLNWTKPSKKNADIILHKENINKISKIEYFNRMHDFIGLDKNEA